VPRSPCRRSISASLRKPRFGTLDEKTLASAFESYRAATPASLAPTAAILESSQNFEINTGLTKPADKLASFDGMYSGEFVRCVK
jgi:hypothetical protein